LLRRAAGVGELEVGVNELGRDVVLESRTWTRVRLESRFLELGLGLETCGLGLGLGLATCGLGLGLDTSGLETWT